jgi:hypothetical protein
VGAVFDKLAGFLDQMIAAQEEGTESAAETTEEGA